MKNKKSEQPKAILTADIAADGNTAAAVLPEKDTLELPSTNVLQDTLLVLALLAAAFVFRFYSLQFFHVISTDGTTYALTARAISSGDWHGVGISGFYPVLIAVTSWFVKDLEAAGRITSIICGSLLVIPLFYLGRTLFSRKIAVAACLMAIVWPSLVGSSCEVITQAAYTTLQLAAVYFMWRAFMTQSALQGCLAGLLMGLSYLTRPEAILLSVVLPAVLCSFSLREIRGKKRFLCSYSVSFLTLFTVNMLLVHHVTGEWQLSAKTDSALNDALSYYLNIPDMNYIPGYQPKSYLDIIREHPAFLLKNTLKNLQDAVRTILPLPLWGLAVAGLVSGGICRGNIRRRLYLLATFSPLAVIIVFYYIAGGYTEAYLPVLFLFAAAGMAVVENKLGSCAQRLHAGPVPVLTRVPLLLLVTAIYAATLLAAQIRKDISDADYRPEMDNGRRAEKFLGRLLKDSLPPGKIMTRWARIAFYAERDWSNVPAATPLAEVIAQARRDGVRFLIADAMLYSMRPELGRELFAPLMDGNMPAGLRFQDNPTARIAGLYPYMIYIDRNSVSMTVYELLPLNSDT